LTAVSIASAGSPPPAEPVAKDHKASEPRMTEKKTPEPAPATPAPSGPIKKNTPVGPIKIPGTGG